MTAADHNYQDDEDYQYDANGNPTDPGFVIGDYNRLESDGTFNYEYDLEGNRTKRTEIATGIRIRDDSKITSVAAAVARP